MILNNPSSSNIHHEIINLIYQLPIILPLLFFVFKRWVLGARFQGLGSYTPLLWFFSFSVASVYMVSVSCPWSLIDYTLCKIGAGTSIHLIGYTLCKIGAGTSIQLIGYTQDQSWKGCVFPGCVPCCVASITSNSWDPVDCSTQCSSVHGFLQASKLEWFVISFSRGYSRPRDGPQVSCLSCIASEFFTTEPPGKPQVTPYANNGLCQRLWWLVMLGPEVLTQVMDFPFCRLFFSPSLFMVPPSWTPLLLFLFFPNHLTDG